MTRESHRHTLLYDLVIVVRSRGHRPENRDDEHSKQGEHDGGQHVNKVGEVNLEDGGANEKQHEQSA